MSAPRPELPKDEIRRSRPVRRLTSDDFRKRATHYRLAAAMTDIPRDVATFSELAMMFDQIAYQFGQAELEPVRSH